MSINPQLDLDQFDLEKLIRTADVVRGVMPLADITELADRVVSRVGGVGWSLSARRDQQDRIHLRIGLDAVLDVQCQRCLGPMQHAVDHQWSLLVVRDESALPELEDEQDDVDTIVVPGMLDVGRLVIEELLLVLPMMPRHETQDCHGPEHGGEGRKPSPFAVLQSLRKA